MDKLNRSATGALRSTRDVGVLCGERVPVNDKCIMVGTTGIAALKAEYGDDFTNFEIIQDVGYSSESSTHLSGDDAGLDQHFNVRIYKYSKDGQPLDLRGEFESPSSRPRDFPSLGSSVESSSSTAASLDDSGLGAGEALTNGDSADVVDQDEFGQDDLDYLETVLDECVDFCANIASEPEELHFTLSGLDSDDSSDNFHNRSSFTSSAQVFYKMISVDSDNGETENNNNNEISNISQDAVLDRNLNVSTVTVTNDKTDSLKNVTDSDKNNSSLTVENSSFSNSSPLENSKALNASVSDDAKKPLKCASSDSDPETYKPIVQETLSSSDWGHGPQVPHRIFCSTPIRSSDKHFVTHRFQSLKRKRDSDFLDVSRMSSRVRSWLNRCSDFSIPSRHRRPTLRASPDLPQTFPAEDISSCDASCEYTSSSSADEGNNVYSSMSSFGEDDVFRQKSRVDSGSAEGSVETVLHALLDSDCPFLLPPPPSSSASFGSGSKICSTICYQTSRRGRYLKASSDGELSKRSSRKELSNLPGSLIVQRLVLSKTGADPVPRLYSSLPNVLRHLSDSSTDDLIPSTLPSHSDSKTTGFFQHSSSSELGRRRRRRSRRKSSSSNRSSTSALLSCSDRGRMRSRTATSSSRCGSRRRNASQRSDLVFCPSMLSSDEEKNSPLKVEIPPEVEDVGFEDLRRASSALLSPVESDVVLTHLEEQSTVSDQVWDGYQEMPYLSEGYSEATVDEDAVRKLTDFGDDYGSAIGHPLRLLDPSDGNNNKTEFPKSPKKMSKCIPVVQRVSDDSDSDSEDLHYVLEETDKALHFAKAILRRRQAGEALTTADYAELLATCGTHLRCLQTICRHIDGKEHNFSDNHLQQLRHRIEQWLELKRNTEMFQTLDGPVRQKYLSARENIDALFRRMSQIASCSNLNTETFYSWEDVEKHLSRLQMVLVSLQGAKEQLLSVNLQVHRFTTEYGSDMDYKNCSLKDDVTELYRQWEDIYEQNGAHLTELETLKSNWAAYEEKFQRLRLKEQEIDSSNEDCDNKPTELLTGEDLRTDLEEVQRCASSLENRLKGGDAWKRIDQEVEDLKRSIGRRESQLRKKRACQSENRRCSSSLVEDDADDHFEDAIQVLCEGKDRSSLSTPQKKDAKESPKHKTGRFWRIVRIAVPVQLALVILYCIACCLEPGCCNTLNNFNFSFTPQLRYFGGRPPV